MKKIYVATLLIIIVCFNLQGQWKNFVHFTSFNKELTYKTDIYISSNSGLGRYGINSDSLSIMTTADKISSNKIIDLCSDQSNIYLLHDSSVTIIGEDSIHSVPFPVETGNSVQHIAHIGNTLYISTNNNIIAGNFNGIMYQFSNHPSTFGEFRTIVTLGDTAIVASDSGVIFADAQSTTIWDSTNWYKHYKSELNSPYINSILYKDKKLYFATEKGMNTYFNGTISSIPSTGLSDSNITFSAVIDNAIYAVISNHVYYLENNAWKEFAPLNSYSIKNIAGGDSVIIASNDNNIYKIDLTKKDTSGNVMVSDITPVTLIDNNVAAINCSNNGVLFVLYGYNSSRMDILEDDSIVHYVFQTAPSSGGYSVATDKSGRAWIGFWSPNDSGIVCLDSNRNEHYYPFPSNAPTVSDIKFDKMNRLWMLNYSDYSNLFMLGRDSSWVKYNNSYTEWMYRLHIDRNNDIWLGSYHIGEASCLDTAGIWHKFTLTGSATVSGFADIDDTTMYIATENGIYIVTNFTNITRISQLDNINLDGVVDMTMDPYNNLWIAKADEGVYVKHNGIWTNYSTANGLVGTDFGTVGGGIKKPEKIFSFDKKNNYMYIASFDGISRFYDDSLFVVPDNNFKLHIYPNPINHGKIFLDLIPSDVSVSIYSINGKYMGRFISTDIQSQLSFNTESLSPGIYYAVATNGHRTLAITKFAVTNK